MRQFYSLLVVVVVSATLAACGGTGTSRPPSIPRPDLDAQLLHEIFFGSQNTAPGTVEVRVQNRATVPIAVRRIELDSPGMGQWGLFRTQRYLNETIEPGQTKPILVVVTAYTNVRRPSEPLQIRAIVEFEAGGTRWREILMARE